MLIDWDDLVAEVCANTGWTWEYVEGSLSMAQYYALRRHWVRHPPSHLLVAMFMGYRGPDAAAAVTPQTRVDLARQLRDALAENPGG